MTQVMTVTGPVDAASLGPTLSHEHLLIDLSLYAQRPAAASDAELFDAPVGLANLDRIKRNPYANRDDCLLGDVGVAIEEIQRFQRMGGRTVVDLTNADIGRDPRGLSEIAHATGLNVIAGCGHYVHTAHAGRLDGLDAGTIGERMITDLTEGIDGTGIRAGIIGEIGTTYPIHPRERIVLRAAAAAHLATGVAISVHIHPPYDYGHEVLDLLEAEGVDPRYVVLGHLDGTLATCGISLQPAIDHHASLAARGAYVEYDLCGNNGRFEHNGISWSLPSDQQRAIAVRALIDRGHAASLLLSHDVGHKHYLTRWGGWGYAHVLRTMRLLMTDTGIPAETIEQLLVHNPARMLSAGVR